MALARQICPILVLNEANPGSFFFESAPKNSDVDWLTITERFVGKRTMQTHSPAESSDFGF